MDSDSRHDTQINSWHNWISWSCFWRVTDFLACTRQGFGYIFTLFFMISSFPRPTALCQQVLQAAAIGESLSPIQQDCIIFKSSSVKPFNTFLNCRWPSKHWKTSSCDPMDPSIREVQRCSLSTHSILPKAFKERQSLQAGISSTFPCTACQADSLHPASRISTGSDSITEAQNLVKGQPVARHSTMGRDISYPIYQCS